jgi:hypothetical protein
MRINPFFANYGLHPYFNIYILGNSTNPSTELGAYILEDIHCNLSLYCILAGEWYKE